MTGDWRVKGVWPNWFPLLIPPTRPCRLHTFSEGTASLSVIAALLSLQSIIVVYPTLEKKQIVVKQRLLMLEAESRATCEGNEASEAVPIRDNGS